MIPEWSQIGLRGWLMLPLVSNAMDFAALHLRGIVRSKLSPLYKQSTACVWGVGWGGGDYTTNLIQETWTKGLRSLNATLRTISKFADISPLIFGGVGNGFSSAPGLNREC